MSAIFITGTDTDVGKTLVTAILAFSLRQSGRDVGVFKPFATGCASDGKELVSPDALFLKETLGLKDSLAEICPIRFEEPLAPLVAARRAEVDTRGWPPSVDKSYQKLKKKHEFVIVEGVGGVAVPICDVDDEVWTVADFIAAWEIPAIAVARRTLGTINHTVLTAKSTPNLAGIIFNDSAPIAKDDLAAHTSPDFLAGLGLPVLGHVPYSRQIDRRSLECIAEQLNLDWEAILNPPVPDTPEYAYDLDD